METTSPTNFKKNKHGSQTFQCFSNISFTNISKQHAPVTGRSFDKLGGAYSFSLNK
jgi:hypothetical protein